MKTRFLLFLLPLFGLASHAQHVQGLYVDGFHAILGDQQKEDSLLLFAQSHGFNYLTLYQMHLVNADHPLTDAVSAQPFTDFVVRAKTLYNIEEIGVAGENRTFFANVIQPYNQQHPLENERIDVYNLEFEFWVPSSVDAGGYYCDTYLTPNGFPCGEAGAFDFFMETLATIDSLANSIGERSEAYFGWFDLQQGTAIAQSGVDRILLSAYLPSGDYSAAYQYSYLHDRLGYLTQLSNTDVNVMVLCSAEADFMQEWAETHLYEQPYNDFEERFSNAEMQTSILDHLNPAGVQWFAYSDMPWHSASVGALPGGSLAVYPNPAQDQLFVPAPGEYAIYTIDGKQLLSGNASGNMIAVEALPEGVYVLETAGRSVRFVKM